MRLCATIWHNPRCSKSRETLRLLEEHKVEISVVLYLEQPPSAKEIVEMIDVLGVESIAILRKKESLFQELGLKGIEKTKEEWADLLAMHPRLIERPIVRIGNRAVIGRPPEKVLELLQKMS